MADPARLARYLDPRPASDSGQAIADAVAIPLEELPQRMHELPPRHGLIEIAGPEPFATKALQWLRESGREAILAPSWEYGGDGLGRLWKPNDFLATVAAELTPGKALDLACGTGRDAVHLAGLGWHVTAVDHLPDALTRGQDLARRYLSEEQASRIRWLALDLESGEAQFETTFDLVSIFWFLDRDLVRAVARMVGKGGNFVMETFSAAHRERYGKPRTESFVLKPGEMRELLPEVTVRTYEEGWHGDRHSVRFWASQSERRNSRDCAE